MNQIIRLVFGLGFCWILSCSLLKANTPEMDKPFSDKANLALRQVGDQLLRLAGDEHSTVPPVYSSGSGEFTLQLESRLNYDTLPQLLHQAFVSYKIERNYQVMIQNCNDKVPILGYNQAAFEQGQVPCTGREQWSDCNNIIVTFESPEESFSATSQLPLSLLACSILAMIGFGVFWKKNKKTALLSSPSDTTIPLGHFNFDHHNQTLRIGKQQQALTFRENKLLYFLANNVNEVVKRDTLIDEVWGDEGVMVGRSLDVFISRLRKLLKEDKTVVIKNIHGVGYRLEVSG